MADPRPDENGMYTVAYHRILKTLKHYGCVSRIAYSDKWVVMTDFDSNDAIPSGQLEEQLRADFEHSRRFRRELFDILTFAPVALSSAQSRINEYLEGLDPTPS